MDTRRLTILTLDGLTTSCLGCYGSSWNSTPNIDLLASHGCVWDRWITPTDDPVQLLKQWTQGDSDHDPFAAWRERGEIELVTDDRRVLEHEIGAVFDKVLIVDPIDTDHAADEIETTQLARLVATAVDRSTTQPAVLWIHSRFLTRSWDAPRILLDHEHVDIDEEPSEEVELLDYGSYQEDDLEEQPAPLFFEQTQVPNLELHDSTHPDLITAWMTTYGCQVRLIDTLLPFLQEAGGNDHVLMLAGTSGFSFGQNGWIGHQSGPLRSCHTRLPLIVGCEGPLRYGSLTSAANLPAVISALAAASPAPLISPEQWAVSDREFEPFVVTRSVRPGMAQQAVTCPSWFWAGDDVNQSLFLKPDDVDDVNDISRLRMDVIEQMATLTPIIKHD